MKILKKFLLIGLCSFCFCISTKALTSEYYSELKYSEELINLVEANQDKIDLIREYYNTRSYFDGRYVIVFNLNTINSSAISTWLIDLSFTDNSIVHLSNVYDPNNSNLSDYSFRFYGDYKKLSIVDNNVNYVSGSGGHFDFVFSYNDSNPLLENVILNIDNLYFDTSLVSEEFKNSNIAIKSLNFQDYQYYIPTMINDVLYIPPTETNYFDFLNSFVPMQIEENVCDRTAVLGSVSNVNEIKLNVKGDTSVFYPLKGTFTLNYTSNVILNEDMFNVDFVNNSEIDVVGNYSFNCSTNSNNCYLNYEYNSMDDIIETIDFSFKVRSSDNGIMPLIKIYACVTNDDYTNISYDYTIGSSDSTTSNPNTDNYLQDGNINDASGTAGSFFENFTDNDYGLSSIITIPLTSIQKITNSTCTPISFPIPFTNKNIDLPCMISLYEQNIPLLLNIWQTISFGIISYAIIVNIFGLVKKFKDPNDDKLEVMDL